VSGSKFSLRDVPWTIYIAIAVSLAGSLANFIADLWIGDTSFESFEKLQRWRMLDGACSEVYVILLPLGFLELAKRQLGSARSLGIAGASLLFVHVAWAVIGFVMVAWQPQDDVRWVWDWTGRFVLLCTATAYVLLTIAADAWRRVTFAAVILVILLATSYHVPVIGQEISDLLGKKPEVRQLYSLLREAVTSTMLIFIAAALAARGTPTPHPMRAASGFLMARVAILVRLSAAVLFGLLAFGAKQAGIAKLLAFGIPLVMVSTMLIYSIGLVQIASSRFPDMPRIPFVLGAATALWWLAIQFHQLPYLVAVSRDKFSTEDALETLQLFSLAGPIVQIVGMVLVGNAIHSYAIRAGQLSLASAAVPRLLGFAVLMLVSVIAQAAVFEASTPGKGIALLLLSAATGIAALGLFVGLLGRAGSTVAHPEPPQARVV
jgi:hypothetical protein